MVQIFWKDDKILKELNYLKGPSITDGSISFGWNLEERFQIFLRNIRSKTLKETANYL